MHIRPARLDDRECVRQLYFAAFADDEREAVAGLAVDLLVEVTSPAAFALVAETDGGVVGHVAFSPVSRRETGDLVGYILAPLAVHPEFQKQGIGTALIRSGIEELSARGAAIVFVYGDPQYYGRLGFTADAATPYVPPYELQYEFGWQARLLTTDAPSVPPVMLTCVPSLMDPQLW